MEGAEHFDFFRQPDFLKEPLLAGSYAVYKKETLIGEGTGKLCHIHRPQIIDARGRRCWGDLSVVGNELRITIPEWWLSEAKYPVVVDPTIGTTTVGSQIKGVDPNNDEYDRPWLDNEFALNKYLVSEKCGGVCTAYVYAYSDQTDYYVLPILYNNVNNKPYKKLSINENDIDVEVFIPYGMLAGWRNNTFEIEGSINAGDYIWFGILSSWFTTRFDYGGECYKGWFDWITFDELDGIPLEYIDLVYASFCTIKWSMYFNYTAITSQNYLRTLTQGVNLYATNINKTQYKRTVTQEVQVTGIATGFFIICRKIIEAVNTLEIKSFSFLFVRPLYENVILTDTLRYFRVFFRGLIDNVHIESKTKIGWVLLIKIVDTVYTVSTVFRGLIFFVSVITSLFVRDYILRRFLIARQELVIKSCVCREIVMESKIE
jgi:hypothetical protein